MTETDLCKHSFLSPCHKRMQMQIDGPHKLLMRCLIGNCRAIGRYLLDWHEVWKVMTNHGEWSRIGSWQLHCIALIRHSKVRSTELETNRVFFHRCHSNTWRITHHTKGKGTWIYTAPRWQASRPQGAQTCITRFNLQTTPCQPLAFVHIHQMAPPQTVVTSFYRPWKDQRLSWPSWLTYSRRFTHISGHPSAVAWSSAGQDTITTQQLLLTEQFTIIIWA